MFFRVTSMVGYGQNSLILKGAYPKMWKAKRNEVKILY